MLRDFLIICLIPPALFVLSFGGALLQEKDTFSILLASARMQITGSKIEPVGSSGQRWLIRTHEGAERPTDKHHPLLDNYMSKRGWLQKSQQGAVGVYDRGNQRIYVRYKLFTPKYLICQADRQP